MGRAVAGIGEQADPVGLDAVGDPHLAAIDDVIVAVGAGIGLDRCNVRSGARLGQAECRSTSPIGDPRQVALLLLLGSRDHDRSCRKPREQEHEPEHIRVLGHLFYREREPHDPRSGTAVLLGNAESQQVSLLELIEDVLRVITRGINLASARLDLVLGKSPDGLLEGAELFC